MRKNLKRSVEFFVLFLPTSSLFPPVSYLKKFNIYEDTTQGFYKCLTRHDIIESLRKAIYKYHVSETVYKQNLELLTVGWVFFALRRAAAIHVAVFLPNMENADSGTEKTGVVRQLNGTSPHETAAYEFNFSWFNLGRNPPNSNIFL